MSNDNYILLDKSNRPIYTEAEAIRIAEQAAGLAFDKLFQRLPGHFWTAVEHFEKGISAHDNLPGTRLTLTIEQMAQELNISKLNAYKLVKEGAVPAFHVGKRILINRRALEEWIDQQCAYEKEAANNGEKAC